MNSERKLLVILSISELPEECAIEALQSLGGKHFKDDLNRLIAEAMSRLFLSGVTVSDERVFELIKDKLPEKEHISFIRYAAELFQLGIEYHFRFEAHFNKGDIGDTTRTECYFIKKLRMRLADLTQELIIKQRKREFLEGWK